jgi:hypothetical protein
MSVSQKIKSAVAMVSLTTANDPWTLNEVSVIIVWIQCVNFLSFLHYHTHWVKNDGRSFLSFKRYDDITVQDWFVALAVISFDPVEWGLVGLLLGSAWQQ